MDKIRKVFLDEAELKQANKYKEEIGADPIVCRMLFVLNELVDRYEELSRVFEQVKELYWMKGKDNG